MNNQTLEKWKKYPFPKHSIAEVHSFLTCLIEYWVSWNVFLWYISFKGKCKKTWNWWPHEVVKSWEPICKENLARKSIEVSKVNFSEHEKDIFVKVVAYHPWNSSISQSPMSKKKPLKKSKLRYSIVRTSYSLSSLFTSYSNPNMSFHYHRNIICSISNRQADPFLMLFCNSNYFSFLFWTNSTANHTMRVKSESKDSIFQIFILKNPF